MTGAGSGRERAGRAATPLSQQRRKARHYGVQALYRWQLNGGTPAEIEAEFRTAYDLNQTDIEYFRAILEGVIYHHAAIDAQFAELLDRELSQLTPVELALLRQGVYELQSRPDVPYRVVISEAVALAGKFGAAESFKYINGVLDRVASRLRAVEVRDK